MSHIKPTPEAGLTAEEEAEIRARTEIHPGPFYSARQWLATLDAARAETAAVRVDLGAMGLVVEQQDRDLAKLRILATELVEGLSWATDNLHKLARLHWKGGDPDWNDVKRCRDLLIRARAQGIGGERGDTRLVRVVKKEKQPFTLEDPDA